MIRDLQAWQATLGPKENEDLTKEFLLDSFFPLAYLKRLLKIKLWGFLIKVIGLK